MRLSENEKLHTFETLCIILVPNNILVPNKGMVRLGWNYGDAAKRRETACVGK
jgi:hypothetical protein